MSGPVPLMLTEQVFDRLARGVPDPDVAAFVRRGAHSVTRLLLRTVAEDPAAASAFADLAALERRAPHAVARVLRHPAVGAWARVACGLTTAGDAAAPARMRAVAASAAARAGIAHRAVLPADDGLVMLPSLGAARTDETAGTVVVADGRLSVDGRPVPHDTGCETPHWQGLRVLRARGPHGALRLTLDDLDPFRFPSHAAGRLDAVETARWAAILRGAWTLLGRDHPAAAAEVRALASTLTPIDGYRGGTSRAAFGCVATTPPRDPVTFAETLVHEAQHAKLTVLLDLVDLARDEGVRRYPAAWRADPRPLGGLLHGAYAHVGVAAFWRRRHAAGGGEEAHARALRWWSAAGTALATVEDSGALTPLGHRFAAGLRAALAELSPHRATAAPGRYA